MPSADQKAHIGGSFSLIDFESQPFSNTQLQGKYHVIYFGFTHCPNVCPNELQQLQRICYRIEKSDLFLDNPEQLLVPVFISIDPNRDTPERLKAFSTDFHPRTIWLTGNIDEIESIASKYRVYHHYPSDKHDIY